MCHELLTGGEGEAAPRQEANIVDEIVDACADRLLGLLFDSQYHLAEDTVQRL